jgi:putative ABC transport system substrate-binding protein
MKRREFIAGLSSSAALTPLAALAQQADPMRRVAILMGTSEHDGETQRRIAAFRKGLHALGWVEGKNIRIEARWGGGNLDRIRAHARDIVQSKPNVVLTNGTPSTAALQRETSTIPVVFAVITDPVGDGFVASLSRPGGNITGFSAFDSEVSGKWMEFLKEMAPTVARTGILFNPRTVPGGGTRLMRPFLDAAARSMATEPVPIPVENASEIEPALAAHAARSRAGLIAMPDGFLFVNSALIVRLTNELKLPTVYPFRHFATIGGLMSYGVDTNDLNLRAATYVDRILKGAKPAELPVQTPVKFELVINLATAKTMGLTVPLSLQSRADEVIE